MRILIAEDDFTSRMFLNEFLSRYGECDITVDGVETLDAFLLAHKDNLPYDLICLDIMMPKVDGVRVLKGIRDIEMQKGIQEDEAVKVIMVTALAETQYVQKAFEIGCDAYAAKPLDTDKLIEVIKKIGLVE